MNKIKCFIVGLDGATFDLLLPWIQEGHLPFFKKLLSESAWGQLHSTYPPLTAPAWASFMTGKKPGNHGIFDFFYRKPDSYEQSLHSILSIKDQTFWDILGDDGRTVGVINLPLTYPPQPVNGFMISGLLTPHDSRKFIKPDHLLAEIEEKVGPYLLHHDYTGNPKTVIEEANKILEYRTKVALYLYKKHPKDFFMVHYYSTDRIQHEFWHLMDPKHPLFNQKQYDKYKDLILGFYRNLDSQLQILTECLDENTLLIVMSDHGFGPIDKFMSVNKWLLDEGFIRLRRNVFTFLRRLLFSLGFTYSNIAKLILKLGLGKKAIQVGRYRRQKIQEKIFLSLRDVDWKRTIAYSIGNFGQIFINMKGREPKGIIPDDKYKAVCQEIEKKLKQFADPQTAEKVTEKVLRKEQIFQGEYLFQAPDLFFLTNNMTIKPNGLSDFTSKAILETAFASTGHHRLNGILIGYNPLIIKKDFPIKKAGIIDIVPTILYAMGSPVPSDMDGRILLEIFHDSFIEKHPQLFSEPKRKNDTQNIQTYNKLEEEKVKKELRKLGYI